MFNGKIFGIGWHKTATTSLQAALDMLGFPGVHWPHQLFPEIAMGKIHFKMLEQVQSLTDFPVPLIYKRLDKGYPDSKFILTIRDTESWLTSVENHFRIMSTPKEELGGMSINDDIRRRGIPSDHIHMMAYRQIVFDPDVFREAYERHNLEVIEYFKNRPDDLLIMDMNAGDNWDKLCPFLDAVEPDTPYPTAHKTSERH